MMIDSASAFFATASATEDHSNRLRLVSALGNSFSKVLDHPRGARSRQKELDPVVREPKLVQERGLEKELEALYHKQQPRTRESAPPQRCSVMREVVAVVADGTNQ